MVRTPEYREASSILMNQAFAELAAGDLRQASEKGWGATAQMLKAIAEQRGMSHESHRDVRRVLFVVARESAIAEHMVRLFRVSDSLHTNWYENWDSEEAVAYGLKDVEELVGLLYAHLNEE